MGFLDDMEKGSGVSPVTVSPFEKSMLGEVTNADINMSAISAGVSGLSPDEAAEAKRLSGALGLPQVVVETKLQDARKQKERIDLLEAAKTYPAVAELLKDPNAMKVAADDIQALSATEAAYNSLSRGVQRFDLMHKEWQSEQFLKIQEAKSKSFLDLYKQNINEGMFFPFDVGAAGMRKLQAVLSDVMGIDPSQNAQAWLAAANERQKAMGATPLSGPSKEAAAGLDKEDLAYITAPAGRVWEAMKAGDGAGFSEGLKELIGRSGKLATFALETAGESVPQLGVMAAVNYFTGGAAAAATMGGMSYATERYTSPLDQLAAAGFDINKAEDRERIVNDPRVMEAAQKFGFTRGMIIGTLDALSAGVAGWGAKTGEATVMQHLAKSLEKKGLTESAAKITEEIASKNLNPVEMFLAAHPVMNMTLQAVSQATLGGGGEAAGQYATTGKIKGGDVLMEALAEFASAPGEVLSMGMDRIKQHSIESAMKAYEADVNTRIADETVSSLDALKAAKTVSFTQERDPQTYGALLDILAKRTGVEKIFVPAEKLVEVYQGAHESGIVDPDVLDIALGHGGDVAISLPDFMTRIDEGTYEKLKPYAKYSEEAWSAADAQSFRDNIDLIAQEQGEAFVSEMKAELARVSPAEKVFQEIYQKNREAGLSDSIAYKNAAIDRATYRSLGRLYTKAGFYEDEWEFYNDFQRKVQRAGPTLTAKQIDEIDFQVAALKARIKNSEKKAAALERFHARRQAEHDAKQVEMYPNNPEQRTKYVRRYRSAPKRTPILNELIKLGGIDPTSEIAKELKAMDITPKTFPRLFKNGKLRDIDNFPKGEGRVWDSLPDEAGYISRNALLDAINDEQFGRLLPDVVGSADYDAAETARINEENLDQFENYLDELGLKLTDPIEKIKEAIRKDQALRGSPYGTVNEDIPFQSAFQRPFNVARAKELTEKAKELTGTTTNPLEAGYITIDGEMLDLSGRHYASGYEKKNGKYVATKGDYLKGQRSVDHREVSSELMDDGGTDGMLAFMREAAAIRVDFNSGTVGFSVEPNGKQLSTIVKAAQLAGVESLNVEFSNPSNGEPISQAYIEKITPANILKVFNKKLFNETLFQAAYHGSPYRFERFDLSKIGTGEGAQAYGWGQYFAESKDVAEDYRRKLSKVESIKIGRKDVTSASKWMTFMNTVFEKAYSSADININGFINGVNWLRGDIIYYGVVPDKFNKTAYASQSISFQKGYEAALDFLRGKNIKVQKGQLYQVHIPDEDVARMLDWDKPLSEQSGILGIIQEKIMDRNDNGDFGSKHLDDFIDDILNDVDEDKSITGRDFYDKLRYAYDSGDFEGNRASKAASEYLNSLGIVGIKYLDGTSRSKGEGTSNFVVFDQGLLDKISDSIITHYQKGDVEPNASYRFFDRMITMFKGANATSMIHEMGHDWLEIMGQFADRAKVSVASGEILTPEQIEAQNQIISDFDKIMKYLGVNSREEIQTEHHEKWARSVEAYVMEGKAPSEDLKPVFAAFVDWMKTVYGSLKAFAAKYGVDLNPEIRGVMDRIMATDEEIRRAQSEVKYDDSVARYLTEVEAKAYKRLREGSSDDATLELLEKVMKPIRQSKFKWWKDEREAMAARVEKELNEQQDWAALNAIRDKEKGLRLSRKETEVLAGVGAKDVLPSGVFARTGGVSPDIAAPQLGYRSGADLLNALGALKDLNFKQVVDAETDRRMKLKHGDPLSDGSIVFLAREAIRNEKRAALLAMEYRALKRAGADAAIQKAAERRVVSEGALDPQAYRSEAAVAETAAEKMFAEKSGAAAGFTKRVSREERRRYREAAAMEDLTTETARREAYRETFLIPVSEANQTAKFSRAEVRYAELSRRDILNNKPEEAAKAKFWQIKNHFLFLEMKKRQEEMRKALKRIDILNEDVKDIAKGYDADFVKAGKHVLFKLGMGNPVMEGTRLYEDNDLNKWRNSLSADEQNQVGAFLDLVDNGMAHHKDMNIGQYIAALDALNNLVHISRQRKVFELNGKQQTTEETVTKLIDEQQKHFKKERKPGQEVSFLEDANAAGRKMENYCDMISGGDVNGAHMDVFIRSMFDKTTKYRLAKNDKMKELKKLFEPFGDTFAKPRVIRAKELTDQNGNPFEFNNLGELLMAVLHTGNISNKTKLLVGYGWTDGFINQKQVMTKGGKPSFHKDGTPIMDQGELDTARWDAFLARMFNEGILKKEHMDLAQSVWDLNESMKPDAQAAHKEVYGYNFAEITADAVQTPFGAYRGGYIPAKVDYARSVDGKLREAREAMEGQITQTTFPTTGRGFTFKRNEAYREPLDLNLMALPAHLDAVLRFTHLQPTVNTLGRILTNRRYQQEMKKYDPSAVTGIFLPWLQRTAKQTLSTKSTAEWARRSDPLIRWFRVNTGMQMLSGNISNALQQLTGYALSKTRIPAVKLLDAVQKYARSPIETGRLVGQKSEFMRTRIGESGYETMIVLESILKKPGKIEELRNISKAHAYFLQAAFQRVVDIGTWLGAYNHALAKKADGGLELSEADAIFHADSVVRQTQGGYTPEELSAFETGTEGQKMFAQFFSYFNNVRNLLQSEYGKTMRDDALPKGAKINQLFGLYVFGVAIPAIVSDAIVKGLSGRLGDADDDDETADDIADLLVMSQVRYATAMVPLAGSLTTLILNDYNDKWYDDKLNLMPITSPVESVAHAPKSLWRALFDDGDKGKAVKDVAMAIGFALGLPLTQAAKPVAYLTNVSEGKADPEDWTDWVQGILSGRDGTERKR